MQKTINLIRKSGKKRIQKIKKKRIFYNALTDAKSRIKRIFYNALTDAKITDKTYIL